MDLKVNRDNKNLTQLTLKKLEAKNVDYYVNEHLKLLKAAMDEGASNQITFHTEQLLKLSVARYKIDPNNEIERMY